MKKASVSFFALFLIVSVCWLAAKFLPESKVSNPNVNDDFFIVIDAGHGGMDGGTTAADGTLEKDINLSIANKLNAMLKAAGFNTVMVRETDELIGDNSLKTIRERKVSDIRKRLSIAESYPNSLLISIHQNHYGVEKYSGAQVFYSPNSPESQIAADEIQKSIVSLIQQENSRQIKKCGTNIYLLYNITTPAVMVECGFLSNREEAEKLKTDKYQREVSFAVMQGIFNYLE